MGRRQFHACVSGLKGREEGGTFGKKQIERAFRIASFTEQEDATENIGRPRDVK